MILQKMKNEIGRNRTKQIEGERKNKNKRKIAMKNMSKHMR